MGSILQDLRHGVRILLKTPGFTLLALQIGIRMALGARPKDVLGMAYGRPCCLAGAGVVLGMIAAMAATRLMSSLLFGVQARDPMVFAVAPAILIAVAMLASYIPARRASRVDPLVALRME